MIWGVVAGSVDVDVDAEGVCEDVDGIGGCWVWRRRGWIAVTVLLR